MPTSPVDGVEVFYGFMLPSARYWFRGQEYLPRTLEFDITSADDDFLVTVVSRVAEYTKAEGYDGALVISVQCDPIPAGWTVQTCFSMHRLVPSLSEDVIDERSPHPVFGEYRKVPRQVILTSENIDLVP